MEHLKKYKIEDESFDENEINNNNELEKELQNKLTYNSLQNNINENSSYQNNNFNTSQIKSNNNNNINLNNSEMNFTDDLLQNSNNNNNEINNENNNEINNENNNFHHVQIIDEDVENFKRRLDILIRNFRTDTLKDFMSIKRNLLTEQKNVIENEKQKCDALISSKSDLIEHLKDDLALTQKNLNSQIIIKENVVNVIFNQKKNKYLIYLKKLAFINVLKKYHNKKKQKKNQKFNAINKYNLKLKNFCFETLKKNWKEMKLFKIVSQKENEFNTKLNEMANYYNKEITDLRNKLNDANYNIEKTNQSKNQLQENLKKVLMRGVMAMNMEAMNVLDKNGVSNNNNFNPSEFIGKTADNLMINNNNNNLNNNNMNVNNNNLNNNNMNINNNNNLNNNNMNINNNNLNDNNLNNNDNININNNNTDPLPKEIKQMINVNQSFQPKNEINVINTTNINPISKDSNWINAAAVPITMKNNILKTTNEDFFHENNNYLSSENDFNEDEINRQYNLTPMNPIENHYVNHNTNDNNNNHNNSNSYYDEMQKSKINYLILILFYRFIKY